MCLSLYLLSSSRDFPHRFPRPPPSATRGFPMTLLTFPPLILVCKMSCKTAILLSIFSISLRLCFRHVLKNLAQISFFFFLPAQAHVIKNFYYFLWRILLILKSHFSTLFLNFFNLCILWLLLLCPDWRSNPQPWRIGMTL